MFALLRPDLGKLVYLALGLAAAAYTPLGRILPRRG